MVLGCALYFHAAIKHAGIFGSTRWQKPYFIRRGRVIFIQMQYIVSTADKTARRIGILIDAVETLVILSLIIGAACCVFR